MAIRRLLGQILVEMGFVTNQQLDEALQKQKKWINDEILQERIQWVKLVSEARLSVDTDKIPTLGQILIDMELITKEQLEEALKEQEKSFEIYRSLENEKLGVAIEIGSLVNSTLDFSEVLNLTMKHVNRVTNSVASTLMLLDEETGELVFCVPTGPKADNLVDVRLPPGEGIAGWVAKHEQPVLIPDVREDKRFYSNIDKMSGLETKSILCVPLKSKTKLIGVLEVINKVDGTSFTKEDELLLRIFGYQAAVALENARLHGELKERLEEHKYTKDALQESEEKYRAVLEASPDPVVVYDTEGKVVYFNPAFTRVFGWTLEERLDKKMDVFVPDETWPKTKMMIDKVLAGESFSGIETRRYTKEGRIIDVSLSGAIYKDQFGNSIGSIIILRDISEQKKLEAQLQRAQKMEALGIMAGGVAHDLNNVLSGIVSYPDLLLAQIPEDSPLVQPILSMQDSGKKAAYIVQDLLTLARRGVVIEEIVNLNEIISEHLKTTEHEKLKSFHPKVEIETSLASDLFNTSGSPVHLSKTVMNLVSNAAEAMPEGGKISISTENKYIDRSISGYDSVEEGDYVTLTVSDTGIGISPEDRERIFEPFYTKKVMGRSGTGLGMAVVWGTVKDHKGYIDVQSTEGKGTTFTLYFPATRRAIDKEKTIMPPENYMGKGESILVVDDVKEQREIVFKLLTSLGYMVDTVSSGEDAVNYMKNKTVDLLILDMIMDPGIDGLDTYKKIIEIHPGQKAIIASGFSETERVKEAQKLGAGQYIKKPYTLEKIGTVVRAELDK